MSESTISKPSAADWAELLNGGEDPERRIKMDGEYIFNLCSPFYEGIKLQPWTEGLEARAKAAYESIGQPVEKVGVVSVSKLTAALSGFPLHMQVCIADFVLGSFGGEKKIHTLCPGNIMDAEPESVWTGEDLLSADQYNALRNELEKCIPRIEDPKTFLEGVLDEQLNWLIEVLRIQIAAHHSNKPEDAVAINKVTELIRTGTPLSLLFENRDAIVLVA